MTAASSSHDFWCVLVPTLAYQSSPVQLGMLTFAAIHLYLHADPSTQDQNHYLPLSEHYGNQFVEQSRRQLQQMQPEEANSNLVCSMLLSVLALAFSRVHRQNGATLSDDEAWTWLKMLRGVHAVQVAIGKAAYGSKEIKIDPILAVNFKYTAARDYETGEEHNVPDDRVHASALFAFVSSTRSERFDAIRAAITAHQPQHTDVQISDLRAAVDDLEEATERICIKAIPSIFRSICTWPCWISKEVVDMLVECNALALAIYTHWLMLVMLMEDHWVSIINVTIDETHLMWPFVTLVLIISSGSATWEEQV